MGIINKNDVTISINTRKMRRFLDSLGYPIEARNNLHANYSREKKLKVEDDVVQSEIDLIAKIIDCDVVLYKRLQ